MADINVNGRLHLKKFKVRKLTPTEYGRLQAFPMDNWEQVVSDSQAYKQFGNAVTVSVVTAIANSLKECLEAEPKATQSQPTNTQEAETYNPLAAYSNAELLEELMGRQSANI